MATSAQHTKDIIPEPATLVARAKAMIPALKARAAQGETERKIPDQTIADFKEAGFFDILKPKRWGGFEMEPQVFFEVQMAIAEGCMSSAWVLGVVGVHPLQLGLFPLQAQEDVWGKDASVLVSSSHQPVGKVEKADGGFYLTGQWSFSSGCQHCDWVFAGALVFGPEGTPPEYRTFLVPRSDYQIVDTWNTFGLKATGSHDVKIDRPFVPEHRTHKAMDGFLCRNPGQKPIRAISSCRPGPPCSPARFPPPRSALPKACWRRSWRSPRAACRPTQAWRPRATRSRCPPRPTPQPRLRR